MIAEKICQESEDVAGGSDKSSLALRDGKRYGLIALIFILVAAAFLRFYKLQEIPPGFHQDEARASLSALDLMSGHIRVHYPLQDGGGSLWVYIVAAFFAVLGPGILALRLTAAFVGLVNVSLTYKLTRELFSSEGETTATFAAVLSALWMALLPWSILQSRVGFAVITVPTLVLLCFYFLWRGLRTAKRRYFMLSGAALGLSLYSYVPTRFLFPILFGFFIAQWLVTVVTGQGPALVRRYSRELLMLLIAAVVAAIPLVYGYFASPEYLSVQSGQIAVLRPWQQNRDVIGSALLLLNNFYSHLTAFGLTLDWLKGIPEPLLVDPLTALLLSGGLLLSLARWKRQEYLFLVIWWLAMLLPSAIASGVPPSPIEQAHPLRRIIGGLPASSILPALFLVASGQWLNRLIVVGANSSWRFLRPGRHLEMAPTSGRRAGLFSEQILRAAIAVLILGGLSVYLGITGVQGLAIWSSDPKALNIMRVYDVALAQRMNQETDLNAVFLILLNSAAGEVYAESDVLNFLHREGVPFAWIKDEETSLPQELAKAIQGHNTVRVVTWKVTKVADADPKGVLPFLLQPYSFPVGMEQSEYFQTTSYELRKIPADFADQLTLQQADTDFGGVLRLVGLAYGNASGMGSTASDEIPSGEPLWVTLRWQKSGPGDRDYQVSVWAEDETGRVIGRVDKTLLSNVFHQGTSRWQVRQEERDYYLVPVQEATPPGDYRLKVVVYDAETGNRLEPPGAGGDLAMTLGEIHVAPAFRAVEADSLAIGHPGQEDFGAGLRFLGHDLDVGEALRPGEQVSLTLYWQATERPGGDYGLEVWLSTPAGEEVIVPRRRLVGEAYPTARWQAGEVLRTWQMLRVPAGAQNGEYGLELRVIDMDGGETIGRVSLGQVRVAGRPRVFEVPEMGQRVGLYLGDGVELLGYDLPLGPGEALPLTLYWRARSEMDVSYTVFVHLLDQGGQVVAQRDSLPQNGEAPTSGWLESEVIADRYEIPLPGDLPPGRYTVELGMYDAETGERLPVTNRQGELLGDRVLIEEGKVW